MSSRRRGSRAGVTLAIMKAHAAPDWTGFNPNADNAVQTIAVQADGKILVGGDFTLFNGVTRNRITRLNPNGKTDATINFGTGANGFINALAIQPDRKILIGGFYYCCNWYYSLQPLCL